MFIIFLILSYNIKLVVFVFVLDLSYLNKIQNDFK